MAGRIVELFLESAGLALVDVFGVVRTINVGLVENEHVAAGDWVLIHMGFAMAKMDEAEARASMEILEDTGPGRDRESFPESEPMTRAPGPGRKKSWT